MAGVEVHGAGGHGSVQGLSKWHSHGGAKVEFVVRGGQANSCKKREGKNYLPLSLHSTLL